MSVRSIVRAHQRSVEREGRRSRRRAAQVSAGTAVALGAGALFAPGAQAAIFEVDSLTDAAANGCNVGVCTLRDAIEDANADDVDDQITFDPEVDGVIRLTEGELPVDAGISLSGPGASVLAISGDANDSNAPDPGDSRIFAIDPTVVGDSGDVVAISGLTLTEGYMPGPANSGGAIYSQAAALVLTEVVVTNSYAGNDGGGVAINYGTISVNDSLFTGNEANSYAGGLSVFNTSGGATAHVVVTGTQMTGNEAADDGGAFYFERPAGDVVIADTTISGNEAGEDGGGGVISNYGTESGTTTVARTTFSGNESTDSGGGLWLLGPKQPVAIVNSTFHGNTGGYGGGIASYNGQDVAVTIAGSTITGNTAAVGDGGGVYRFAKDTAVGTDSVFLRNTIVAGNTAAGAGDDLGEGNNPVDVFDIGFSLVQDSAAAVTVVPSPAGSNLLGVAPALGPLTDNGGPTQTRLPGPSSPVIDAGSAFGLTVDQRGFVRPADASPVNAAGGDGSDIGAVEVRVPGPATITSGPEGPTTDTTPTFAFASAGAASLSCSLDGAPFTVCTSPLTTPELADGDHTFRVRGNGPEGVASAEDAALFTVDTAIAGADIDIAKKQEQKGEKVKLKVKAGAEEDVDATAKGKITVKGSKKKFKLEKVSKEVAAGKQKTLKLKPKDGQDSEKILDLLDDGEKLTAKVSGKLTDALGNELKEKKNVKLKEG